MNTHWKSYVDNVANFSLGDQTYALSVYDWATVGLRMQALEHKKTVVSMKHNGAVEDGQFEEFLNVIEKLKSDFHMIETSEETINKWTKSGKKHTGRLKFVSTFIDDEFAMSVSFDGKESSVSIQTFNKEKANSIINLFSPLLKKKRERKGRACVLLVDQNVYVSDLGPAGEPLVRENYLPNVIEDYDFLVKDLASENPRGRLAILEGPPGSGKSFFVRGLINDIENSIFLIVPSSLISHLSEPSFMPAIMDLHEEEQAPIILVLEDADAALLPRGNDNMSTISDMLNFADGIVGKIIDFRIIATTNAKKMDIEEALLRKGRLSRHLHISHLPTRQAVDVYRRITGVNLINEETKELLQKATLAEVYDLAYELRERHE